MFENIAFGAAPLSGDPDFDRGVAILQQLHDVMTSMYGDFLPSVDDLVAYYTPGKVLGLGLGANVGGQSVFTSTAAMSPSATLAAMTTIAKASGGTKVPSMNDLTAALQNQAIQPSLWQEAKFVVGMSAGQVETGLEKIGDTTIAAGQIAVSTLDYSKYLIYLLPLVGIWWFVKNRDALSSTALAAVTKKMQGNPRRKKRRSRR